MVVIAFHVEMEIAKIRRQTLNFRSFQYLMVFDGNSNYAC